MMVEPHATRAGFLFFDVSALDQPLAGAKLYLRKLRGGDGKSCSSLKFPLISTLNRSPAR